MKKEKFMPYGVDMEYEYRTYKNVGRDYGDNKIANLGFVFNIIRFFRKRNNRKQGNYAFCNTYTEWKNHVGNVINTEVFNKEDLLHFFYRNKNNVKMLLNAISIILIPIYISFIPIINTLSNASGKENSGNSIIIFIVYALIIAIFSTDYYIEFSCKVNFYNDFIKIAEELLLK